MGLFPLIRVVVLALVAVASALSLFGLLPVVPQTRDWQPRIPWIIAGVLLALYLWSEVQRLYDATRVRLRVESCVIPTDPNDEDSMIGAQCVTVLNGTDYPIRVVGANIGATNVYPRIGRLAWDHLPKLEATVPPHDAIDLYFDDQEVYPLLEKYGKLHLTVYLSTGKVGKTLRKHGVLRRIQGRASGLRRAMRRRLKVWRASTPT